MEDETEKPVRQEMTIDQKVELKMAVESFLRYERELIEVQDNFEEAKAKVLAAIKAANAMVAISVDGKGFIVAPVDDEKFSIEPCELITY